MKRLGLCILIGIGGTLFASGIIKLRENKIKSILPDRRSFNSKVKIKIGNENDNTNLIKITFNQARARVSRDYKFSSRQIDKNTFEITVKNADDTSILKKLLTESIDIKFTETFTLGEIAPSFQDAEQEITERRNLFNANSKVKRDLLSGQLAETEKNKENGIASLTELVNFSTSYKTNDGVTKFPSTIGWIKKKDTVYLNKILNDEKIKSYFPTILKFAYGHFDVYSFNDSLLNLYALKLTDQELNPHPKGEQIVDAMQDFAPTTGEPIIHFTFNAAGSRAWYLMTLRNTGKSIAISANDIVLSAPTVEGAIEGGKSNITGNFTIEECRYLCTMILSKKLALPVKIVETKFIEASKQSRLRPWMIIISFLIISSISYGVSFLIQPASKP